MKSSIISHIFSIGQVFQVLSGFATLISNIFMNYKRQMESIHEFINKLQLNKQMTSHILEDQSKESLYSGLNLCCGQKSCQDNMTVLKDRVGQLTEAVQQIDLQIKNLTEIGPKISKEQLLTKIMDLPDCYTLLNPHIKNSTRESNLFSFKDSIGLDSTLSFNSSSRIYEVPVQMDFTIIDQTIDEHDRFNVEQLQEYFKGFQKWTDMPTKLQKTLTELLKTQSNQNILKKGPKQSFFLPLETSCFKTQSQTDELNLEESMTLSEIKNLKKSTTSETVSKKYQQQQIQTEPIKPSIQECLIKQEENQENWFEAQQSVNRLKQMFTQIPSQIFPENQICEEEQTNNMTDQQIGLNQQVMHGILIEVDEVLGSIQQMLYQLPNQIFEEEYFEEYSYEEEVIEIEDIYAIENEALKREKVGDETWNQADLSMSRLSQLILDIPSSNFRSFKPQTIIEDQDQSSVERQVFNSDDQCVQQQQYKGDIQAEKKIFNMNPETDIFDEINTSFTNIAKLRKQLYNIPTEFQVLDNSDDGCDLSMEQFSISNQCCVDNARLDCRVLQINDNILWKEVQGKFEVIQKFIEQTPIYSNQIFDYIPPANLMSEQEIQKKFDANKQTQQCNEQKEQQQEQQEEEEIQEADESMERRNKIKWARVDNQNQQLISWKQLQGNFMNIKKLVYEVPFQYHTFDASITRREQQIQTEFLDQYQEEYEELLAMATSTDSCYFFYVQDQFKEKISARERKFNQIIEIKEGTETKRKNSEGIQKMKIEQIPITHTECIMAEYDIPIDLEIQSEISSATCSEVDERQYCIEQNEEYEDEDESWEEVPIPVELKFAEIPQPTNNTYRVAIKNYQLPMEMEIIDEVDQGQKAISETVELKQDKFILMSNIFSETIVHQKKKEFFEIPIQMAIYEEKDQEDIDGDFPILSKCITQETQTFTELSDLKRNAGQKQQIEIEELDLKEKSVFDKSEGKSQRMKDCEKQSDISSPRKMMNALEMQLQIKGKSPATSRKNYLLMDLESSQGNRTDRSFYHRRSILGFSKFQDNSINSNMIKEQDINAADFYQILEERNLLEDEKIRLSEEIQRLYLEMEQLKTKNQTQISIIQGVKSFYKKQKTNMAYQLSNFEFQILELQRDLSTKQSEVDILQQEKEILQEKIVKLSNEVGQKRVLMTQCNQDYKEMKLTKDDQIKNLRNQIDEVTKQFNEREQINRHQIESLKVEIIDLRENSFWMKKENEKLEVMIEGFKADIAELTFRHNELIGNLQPIINEKQQKCGPSDVKQLYKVYEGQFRRSMLMAEQVIEQKDKRIAYLDTEIKILEGKFMKMEQQKDKMINEQHQVILELNEKYEESAKAFRNSCNIPSQIQVQLDYLRKQLINAQEEINIKDARFIEMQNYYQRNMEKSQKSMSIIFDRSENQLEDSQQNREEYIHELENLIITYEKVIMNNQNEIKELQDRVCEYLGHAIEKEEELEYFEQFLEGSQSKSFQAEKAFERLDNAAKYLVMMNKKNYPSYVGIQDPMPSPMEVSRLSIEDSTIHKIAGPDSTTETRVIIPRNQSADDSCLYAKAKVRDSRKKKALNQTMKERKQEVFYAIK